MLGDNELSATDCIALATMRLEWAELLIENHRNKITDLTRMRKIESQRLRNMKVMAKALRCLRSQFERIR